ncbi:hypothetical protein Ciccas_003264 [Cichlidogyrus casuarinus]|uniref:Copper type II ascorbate-dependent monooxygenase C-terminal domain-containing protein n=1 Tax=Cichlidogyrus casuarinus TaxID=1844966 RepID=A0ABD2QEY4_9PLAT
MDNNLDRDVYIGTSAQDEMCNFYLMYSVPFDQYATLNEADHYCFQNNEGYQDILSSSDYNLPPVFEEDVYFESI